MEIDTNTIPSNVDELKNAVAARQWWHRIDLGDGVVTPGLDDSPLKLEMISLPERLDGLSVIDVGAWDGFFSFAAEQRGASRVLAMDYYTWKGYPSAAFMESGNWSVGTGMYNKDGFDLAKRALKSRVEEMVIKVEDLSPSTVGKFDVVLFLGVLYHAQDPMAYLRILRSICRGMVVIESLVDALEYPRPAMVFYPGSAMNNDPSNFWGPNLLALEAMLKEVGFSRVEFVRQWADRACFHAWV
jgi:tRNA (mo5U34)-methyltransferase